MTAFEIIVLGLLAACALGIYKLVIQGVERVERDQHREHQFNLVLDELEKIKAQLSHKSVK